MIIPIGLSQPFHQIVQGNGKTFGHGLLFHAAAEFDGFFQGLKAGGTAAAMLQVIFYVFTLDAPQFPVDVLGQPTETVFAQTVIMVMGVVCAHSNPLMQLS